MDNAINDTIKITGTFTLKVFDNGVLVKEYEDKNLVVNGGKSAILNFLKVSSGDFVKNIGFGTNGTIPILADTALTGAYTKLIASSTLAVPDLTFNFTLGTSEANGITIQEFGLLMNSGLLFARKTGISVLKTASVSMVGAWKITLT